jgi:hypothetical protein
MEYTELLKENEALKLQVADYETKILPVYNEHIADFKVKALAEYGLNEEHWLQRLTGATKEEIAEQVVQLALDLRIQERNQPVDGSMGNGTVSRWKQRGKSTAYETGKDIVKKAYDRKSGRDYGNGGNRVSVPAYVPPKKPAPVKTEAEKKRSILSRLFSR